MLGLVGIATIASRIMPFVVYFFVLLITAGSVLFGLDWLSAPMSPMPANKYALHAAKIPTSLPPRPEASTKPSPAVTANPAPRAAGAAAATGPATAVVTPGAVEPTPAPIIAAEPVAAAQPQCDVNACASAYRSFTASDCTYQPFEGPRRLCEKGNPPQSAASATSAQDARAQATCNVAACSQAYFTFTASDCTYQPTEGPRRICTK
jgi:hypothetical protein